jgi:mycoredoxin
VARPAPVVPEPGREDDGVARLTRSPWFQPGLLVAVAAAEVAIFLSRGEVLTAGAVGLALVVLAWWHSPLRGRRSSTPHREAYARNAEDGTVVVYWRPGCLFCSRLRRALGPARSRVLWVNIWADREAAAFLREVNDGAETVPTVLLPDAVRTNPPPREVVAAVG